MSHVALLRNRRFWPLFWTQFLGAFNDNFYKSSVVALITYSSLSFMDLDAATLGAIAAGLFILPFFLFSGTAGQIADKFPKHLVLRRTKLIEIVVMSVGAVGLVFYNLPILMAALFFMGLQSTVFGPAKYSVLPELLDDDHIVAGNALVETGTFIGILIGVILATFFVTDAASARVAAALVVGIAILGALVSRFIVTLQPACPHLTVDRNPVRPVRDIIQSAKKHRPVFLSILGISWFWFLGATLITILPVYNKEVLNADQQTYGYLLSLFCIAMSVGSILCEKMSDQRLELGLVPFGSIGMTVALLDIFIAGHPPSQGTLVTVSQFVQSGFGIRISFDIALLALFGGFYSVPLYTMIQSRSDDSDRSRVIAGNNIFNACFMVVSAAMVPVLLGLDLSYPQLFLVLAVLNIGVAAYIYTLIPEFLLRFCVWILANVMYRIKVVGKENIPTEGPAVLVCNHVTYVDWMLLASAIRTPARFVMYHGFLKMPVVGFLFRDAKVIPIAPAKENDETLKAAFDKIAEELEAGELVCIFPEGSLTKDGAMAPFRRGIEKIVERTPCPVTPMSLDGMWGSFFSRHDNKALKRPFRRFRSRVVLNIGRPIDAADVTAAGLQSEVEALLETPTD